MLKHIPRLCVGISSVLDVIKQNPKNEWGANGKNFTKVLGKE